MASLVTAPTPRRKLQVPRGLLGRALRGLRVLLLIASVLGLTPIAEVIELSVSEHSWVEVEEHAGDEVCEESCAEAGCHGDAHHCGCCAPSPRLAVTPPWSPSAMRGAGQLVQMSAVQVPPERTLAPPWHPPRA
ncbi:hypothetical protein L6R46_19650 [Myxococcota bacterium]|nr:hypothetical protein [Myxococcota bacterium]